jgi:hypothetical protein
VQEVDVDSVRVRRGCCGCLIFIPASVVLSVLFWSWVDGGTPPAATGTTTAATHRR